MDDQKILIKKDLSCSAGVLAFGKGGIFIEESFLLVLVLEF